MRRLVSVLLLVFALVPARAFSNAFVRRDNLSSLENATVYSVVQDSTKAIWISCSAGLMRYNGNSIRKIYDTLPMQEMAYDGGNVLWALSYSGLICIDIQSLNVKLIGASADSLDYNRCKICVRSSSPVLAYNDGLWEVRADTLSYALRLPCSEPVRYIGTDRQGRLYAATNQSLLSLYPEGARTVLNFDSAISSFYFDSRGNFWIGFMDGRVSEFDGKFNHIASHRFQASNVRTFCEDHQGNIWAGSVVALHCIAPDGVCSTAPAASPMAQPVTTLLCDVSGNIWAGTFYSGVYMSVMDDTPFENLLTPALLYNARCASLMANGKVVVLTDGNGAWVYSNGVFKKVPGSQGYKFIASCSIEGESAVYAGLYKGGVVKVTENGVRPVTLASDSGPVSGLSINDLKYYEGKLFMATDEGLYSFVPSPSRNTLMGGFIKGVNNQLLALCIDNEGHLWASGRGLYVLDSTEEIHKVADAFFPAVTSSADGVWAAEFGKGVCCLYPGEICRYDDRSAGILDNTVSFIHPLSGGRLLLGSRTGLSVFSPSLARSLNYTNKNGLTISSARDGCAINLDEDRCLVFGNDGAVLLRTSDIPQIPPLPSLKIDIIEALGTGMILRPSYAQGPLILSHTQNDLLLEFANYDYSGEYSQNYEYYIGGTGAGWVPFNPSSPLSIVGLRPGTYTIMARPAGESDKVSSLSLRVLRPWYFSLLAQSVYLFIGMALLIFFVYMLYSRLLLRQRLRDKEAENENRTKLFIKLSHELRTPLTSVIGQLSLFFKRYGASLNGSALLRQSYKGALEMNRIVSNFLEVEDSLGEEVDDLPSFDRAELFPSGQGEYTMLIADDNADMRALLQDIFSGEYKLLVAKNGREACDMAREKQPDIIVSDVMMPEMDGLTLCATLRKDYETRHIPIVLITAHASERHNLEGLELGADDYIAKPFSVELLLARCRSLIQNRKALAEHMYMTGSGTGKAASEHSQDKFLNAAIGAVERNISSPQLNVTLLCKEMNMSKTTLTMRLKNCSGMSPRDFIEDVRLRHAARMIRDGEVRVADIAEQLNFSSPKYFSIRFRKKFGISPRDYSKGGRASL